MIDSYLRPSFQEAFINPLLKKVDKLPIKPFHLTLGSLVTGIAITPCLAYQFSFFALMLLWISGGLDVLDGSLARRFKQVSPQGAVLDIVCDRTVEFFVVLGLFLVDPLSRGLLCLLMLGSVLMCITSFLVVGIFSENQSEKSFYYSPGIIERTEAFIFFSLMIVLPDYFEMLGWLFCGLVTLTTIIRISQFAYPHRK